MTNKPLKTATFAGGCFWCIEPEFVNTPGVKTVTSGYTGGQVKNPTYEQVCSGKSGHIEAIEVTFDPALVSYAELLEVFWRNIDPLDPRGQFADKGSQYLAGIFTHDDEQKRLAEASRTKAQAMLGSPIASFIRPAEPFYPAEEYHQKFFLKNPAHYNRYSSNNGRKERLQDVWQGARVSVK